MKRSLLITAIMAIALMLAISLTFAEVPQLINYQGCLTDSEGAPLNTTTAMTFTIYEDEAGTTPLWMETHSSITVTGGLFNVLLGTVDSVGAGVFDGNVRWLGIQIDAGPVSDPLTPIVSVAYAFRAVSTDTAQFAADVADNAITTESILDGTITLPDIGQNEASEGQVIKWSSGAWTVASDEITEGEAIGDITEVIASTGLAGGGTSGAVSLRVAAQGITSDHIKILSIINANISGSAAILPYKIFGTAATLTADQTITGDNTFNKDTYTIFGDSSMRINNYGVCIGDNDNPYSNARLSIERNFNTTGTQYGIYGKIRNSGTGVIYGIKSEVVSSTASSGGDVYALYSNAESDGTNRYGLYAQSRPKISTNTFGSSYGGRFAANYGGITFGVYSTANHATYNYGGYFQAISGGTANYGIRADAYNATNNYAGYFSAGSSEGIYAGYFRGRVNVTGYLYKSGGGFKIDHPLNPENDYLYHSFVESPDMMNVYNGNITTNTGGEAIVTLPDYFDALNKDFRYQLTVIGDFAQAIIAEKINNNRFVIKTDKPYIEVSWQVTGIRKDVYAEAHRIPVEVDKPDNEKGTYLHPAEHGQGPEKYIHYEQQREMEMEREKARQILENEPETPDSAME